MDYVEEKLGEDSFFRLNQEMPNWHIKTVDDLRDMGSDAQVIQSLRKVGLCGKTTEKALLGLLSERNECAHPSDYDPELNETLGYVSKILKRMKWLENRHIT